jgi:hypothetical protein
MTDATNGRRLYEPFFSLGTVIQLFALVGTALGVVWVLKGDLSDVKTAVREVARDLAGEARFRDARDAEQDRRLNVLEKQARPAFRGVETPPQ